MKLIKRDHYIDVGCLRAPAVEDDDELTNLLKPKAVLKLEVNSDYLSNFEKIKQALVSPPLKIINKSHNWSISEREPYFIVKRQPGHFSAESWVLSDKESFNTLIEKLNDDGLLTTKVSEGFKIIAGKDNASQLELIEDVLGYWYQIYQGWVEQEIFNRVPWSFDSRRQNRLDKYFLSDIVITIDSVEDEDPITYTPQKHIENVMSQVMDESILPLLDFVDQDRWAYYSVSIAGGGIIVARHCDARAIIWNNEKLDAKLYDELDSDLFDTFAWVK